MIPVVKSASVFSYWIVWALGRHLSVSSADYVLPPTACLTSLCTVCPPCQRASVHTLIPCSGTHPLTWVSMCVRLSSVVPPVFWFNLPGLETDVQRRQPPACQRTVHVIILWTQTLGLCTA